VDAARLREPAQRVSPRARLLWTAEAAVQDVLVLAVLALASYGWGWFEPRWWLVVGAMGVVVANTVAVPRWRYAVHRWEVTDTAVYTQTGWWTLERRIAPMSRIQTVDYEEGAIARLFGLATVTVTTASAAGALQIAGLDRDLARRLTEELTVKAQAAGGDAT
jgi:hypothetical protein